MVDFLTPEELVAVLKSGKYKPAFGSFKTRRADGETGYCCLGVYAEECGLPTNDALFNLASVALDTELGPVLPDDHWLFTEVTGEQLQRKLAYANDEDQSDRYEGPIAVLEEFIASRAAQ